eukprot:g15686.t1
MLFKNKNVGALARTMSAQVASSSHELLKALEGGNIDEVRSVLANTEKGLKRQSLLNPSYECRHAIRTPLMVAVKTGNFAIFQTVLHAFNQLFTSPVNRAAEMKKQLLERDRDGLSVAMHAVRAGHIVVVENVLEEIQDSGATAALTAKDYQQMTLVMHAAASGHAAAFQEVVKAVDSHLSDAEMEEHMVLRSGDDLTLLMIAAASSDKMTFKACVEALRLAVTPHDFRVLMKVRDADGMTFLMHAANPASSRSKKKKRSERNKFQHKGGGGNGGGQAGPFMSRASTTGHLGLRTTTWGASAPSHTERSGPGHQPPRMPVLSQSVSGGASPAPGTRGPGATSEDVLRRHSLQKAVVIGPSDGVAPGDGGDGHDEDEVKHAGHDPGDELDDSLSLSTSASKPPQQRYEQQEPHSGGQPGETVAEMVAPDSPQHLAIPAGNGMDARVPVLKAAVALNREFLWKEQVREVLMAKDSWGRTLASHGILSGNPQVFEVTMSALRADVLDEEVLDLVEDVEQYDRSKPLVVAKNVGGRDMAASVQSKLRLLKRDVDMRAKESTFEAKIQSFIPGKLIVIFQLLLPEVGYVRQVRLGLLLIMSFLAPIIAWASVLIARRRSSEDDFVPRRSVYSYCLAAPAMFVWGTGTSNIFSNDMDREDSNDPEGFGWPESRTAVVLAVGAIIIPAIDGFVNSNRVEQWNDKFSFSRWRFSRQAELRWNKLRAQANKPTKYETGRSRFEAPAPEKVVNVVNVKPGPQRVPAPIAEVAETKLSEEV